MIYQTTSIREVIARVVRNTGVQDSRYILAMDEWIPEALGIMNIKQNTSKHFEDIYIEFHKGKMPCDLHTAEAIEYNGRNLLPSNSTKIVGAPLNARHGQRKTISTTTFTSMPQTYQVNHGDGSTGRIFDSTASPLVLCSQSTAGCQRLLPCDQQWYQIEVPGWITVSFKCGWIRVHYKRVPVDEDGLPLIPENENLKQALYWYCRAMMGGANWEEPVAAWRNPEVLLQKFEFAMGRAVNEITYPTDGELELAIRNGNRLIKDEHYFDRFFETPTKGHHTGEVEVEYSDANRVVPNMPVSGSGITIPDSEIFNEVPIGLINGVNRVFQTHNNYQISTLAVYRNGLLQAPGLHYTLDGVNHFTFTVAPTTTPSLDVILVNYIIA